MHLACPGAGPCGLPGARNGRPGDLRGSGGAPWGAEPALGSGARQAERWRQAALNTLVGVASCIAWSRSGRARRGRRPTSCCRRQAARAGGAARTACYAAASSDTDARPDVAAAMSSGCDGSADPELSRLGRWCALVVNLARRPDRLQRTEQLLSATNPRLWQRMERIDAVDGRTLSLEDEALEDVVERGTLERARRAKSLGIYTVVHDAKNLLVHFDDHLTEGAIACAMSHRKALERVATHPTAEWGLILEDDVSVVVPQVDRAISRILEQLPDDWEAVYLGYHDDDGKPHPKGLRIGDVTSTVEGDVVEVPVGGVYSHCWGLFAWMVKKETARLLADSLFPVDTQVDGAISNWLVRNYGPGRVFKVPPEQLLFYSSCSEEAQDTDIQTMASEEAVVQEYGSWGEYVQKLKKPSPYDEMGMEDIYASLGMYGFDEPVEDAEGDYDPEWQPDDLPTSQGDYNN